MLQEIKVGRKWFDKYDLCSPKFNPLGEFIKSVRGYNPNVLTDMFNRDPGSLDTVFKYNYFPYYLCYNNKDGRIYFVDEWILINIPTLLIGFRFITGLRFDRASIIQLNKILEVLRNDDFKNIENNTSSIGSDSESKSGGEVYIENNTSSIGSDSESKSGGEVNKLVTEAIVQNTLLFKTYQCSEFQRIINNLETCQEIEIVTLIILLLCSVKIFSPVTGELKKHLPDVEDHMGLCNTISSLVSTNIFDDTDY